MENPSSPDGEVIYQKHCLNKALPITSPNTIRLKVESTLIQWNDLRLGFFEENPALQCGDFALKDRLGQWTYQFAVVIDDMEENIGMIVRGEDLRNSTTRQILLMSLRQNDSPPIFPSLLIIRSSNRLKTFKKATITKPKSRKNECDSSRRNTWTSLF